MEEISVLDQKDANKCIYTFKGEPWKFIIGNTYYFNSKKYKICTRYYIPDNHMYILEGESVKKSLIDYVKLSINKIFGGNNNEIY